MNTQTWDLQTLETHFFKAMDLLGDSRDLFLHNLAQENQSMANRLKQLLAAEETADQLFDTALLEKSFNPLRHMQRMIEQEMSDLQDHTSYKPGDQIEGYEVLEHLGSGGMGEVYRVVSHEPIRREIALKLVGRWKIGDEFIKRFQSECQILALMNSDHIAKVYDVDNLYSDHPFFTMEYIDGDPISHYCSHNRLPISDRIQLFLQACEGVRHAHARGIIHGDLKPSNILVVQTGDTAVTKVIDFGGALIFAPETAALMKHTDDMVFGSPFYMSPEQAQPNSKLDFRSDVHGLGAVLFKLLSGLHIYDESDFAMASPNKRLEMIRGGCSQSPTQALKQRDPGDHQLPVRSKDQHIRKLKGDLEWVIMKAVAPDPDDRYETVQDLVEDLNRYLNHVPISAAPANHWYVWRKWLYRNRGVASFVAFLLILLGITAQAYYVEKTALDKIIRTHDFYEAILGGSRPNRFGRNVSHRTVIQSGESQLNDFPDDDWDAKSRILNTFGSNYFTLGDYDNSLRCYETAYQILTAHNAKNDPQYLRAIDGSARCLRHLERYQEAKTLYEEVLDHYRRKLGEDHLEYLSSLIQYAELSQTMGESEKALDLAASAFNGARRRADISHDSVQRIAANYAIILQANGRYAIAVDILQDILKHLQKDKPDHPITLRTMYNLGVVYDRLGQYDRVEAISREIIKKNEALGEGDHPNAIKARLLLTQSLRGQKKYQEALETAESTLFKSTGILSDNHPITLSLLHTILVIQINTSHYTKALNTAAKLIEIRRDNNSISSIQGAELLHNTGLIYHQTNLPQTSIPFIEEAIKIKENIFSKNHPTVITSKIELSKYHYETNKREPAISLLIESIKSAKSWQKSFPENNFSHHNFLSKRLIEANYHKNDQKRLRNQLNHALDLAIKNLDHNSMEVLLQSHINSHMQEKQSVNE